MPFYAFFLAILQSNRVGGLMQSKNERMIGWLNGISKNKKSGFETFALSRACVF